MIEERERLNPNDESLPEKEEEEERYGSRAKKDGC